MVSLVLPALSLTAIRKINVSNSRWAGEDPSINGGFNADKML